MEQEFWGKVADESAFHSLFSKVPAESCSTQRLVWQGDMST